MQKEKKDKNFIQKPIYEGGPKAMKEFIGKNLQYPEEAAKQQIEGTVRLNYTINYKGAVIDTKIISSLGYGCDEEAIRLVKLLQFKVPKVHKLKVKFHKNINIHFKKPKQKPQRQSTTQVQYAFVEKKKQEKAEVKKKENGGYTYTINY